MRKMIKLINKFHFNKILANLNYKMNIKKNMDLFKKNLENKIQLLIALKFYRIPIILIVN